MRLEGQTKLGYYPTPDKTLAKIITWLSIATDSEALRRYLDPCAGKGEALAAVAQAYPGETYGIELSDVRARDAEKALTRVICTGYENARLSDEAYSLVLLNPPYDGENMTGGGTRMEESFLVNRETTYRLAHGGVLVYIIPHKRINERIARHLAGWYTELRCFKIDEGEYDVFDQCVIFGLRRPKYNTPNGDDLRLAQAWAEGQTVTAYEEVEVEVEKATEQGMKRIKVKERRPVLGEMPYLPEGHGEYAIPAAGTKFTFRFQYEAVSPEDMLREADEAAGRLDVSRAWINLAPKIEPEVYVPAMTPKKGHIALQVSGGLLGTNLVRLPGGEKRLIKGAIRKVTVTKDGDEEDGELGEVEERIEYDDRKKHLKKVEMHEQFQNLFATLDERGDITITTNPSEIAEALDLYVEQLAGQLQLRNQPRYDMKPEPWEWAVFDPLSKGRLLPGRNATGLTDFQKHLAIALGRLMLALGAGFINAEMGSMCGPRSP